MWLHRSLLLEFLWLSQLNSQLHSTQVPLRWAKCWICLWKLGSSWWQNKFGNVWPTISGIEHWQLEHNQLGVEHRRFQRDRVCVSTAIRELHKVHLHYEPMKEGWDSAYCSYDPWCSNHFPRLSLHTFRERYRGESQLPGNDSPYRGYVLSHDHGLCANLIDCSLHGLAFSFLRYSGLLYDLERYYTGEDIQEICNWH